MNDTMAQAAVAAAPGAGTVPCTLACPLRIGLPAVLERFGDGDAAGAYDLLRARNPLPSVCAYLCRHPCLRACVHGTGPRPLPVRWLIQSIVAEGARTARLRPGTPTGRRVAVFGAGPAGLAASHDLALQGHAVALFDAGDEPGGRLARIPAFRLPPEVLQADVREVLDLGVQFRPGVVLGRDVTADSLLAQGFDAGVLAIGAGPVEASHVPGDDLPGVLAARDFLARAARGAPLPVPGDVVVLGGTPEAFDAARLAARQGAASVTLVYRRSLADLPVPVCEASLAEKDGVRLVFLAAPVRFTGSARRVSGVVLQKTVPGAADATSRGTLAVGGSEFTLPATLILAAPSRRAPPDARALGGLVLDADGRPRVDPGTQETSVPRVFACGEVVLPAPSSPAAVASGRAAAAAVARVLGSSSPRVAEPGPVRGWTPDRPDDPDPESSRTAATRARTAARRCPGTACGEGVGA